MFNSLKAVLVYTHKTLSADVIDTYKFDTKTKTNIMNSSGFLTSIMANKSSIFITKLDKTYIDIDKFINAFFYTKFRTQENKSIRFRNAAVSTTHNIMGLRQISPISGYTEVTF